MSGPKSYQQINESEKREFAYVLDLARDKKINQDTTLLSMYLIQMLAQLENISLRLLELEQRIK